MHGFGGLIWIIIVAIAVFSSIRRNVMRARNAQRVQEAPPQAQAYAMPPVLAPSAPVAPVLDCAAEGRHRAPGGRRDPRATADAVPDAGARWNLTDSWYVRR